MTELDIVAVSHRGAVRDHNEDAVAVAGFVSATGEGEPVRLLVRAAGPVPCLVADGLGGHAAGDRASRLVATYLSDAWMRGADPDSVVNSVRRANDLVYAEMALRPEWTGMGTTLAGVVFADGRAVCVNVGDSRCFRIAHDMLVLLSVDDSPMRPAGGADNAVQTVVTQTLGGASSRTDVDPHVHLSPAQPGDRFLLCSDGVTDYLDTDVLEKLLRDAPGQLEAARAVLGAALAAGAPDNLSLLLVTVVA